MSENHKAYLKAMGIDVWLSRAPVVNLPAALASDTSSIEPEQTIHSEETLTSDLKPETATSTVATLDWKGLADAVNVCQQCGLSQTRCHPIFAEGDRSASLMIIGEAPSEDEEQQGRPFVGETGQLLTSMLKAMGLQRNQVYITHIVKCHPAQNRPPSVEEAQQCWFYLKRQIDLVQPDVILALGGIAGQRLLQSQTSLPRLRGQIQYREHLNIPIVVSYHPAYLLRSPNEKRHAWEDLQLVMKVLKKNKNSDI